MMRRVVLHLDGAPKKKKQQTSRGWRHHLVAPGKRPKSPSFEWKLIFPLWRPVHVHLPGATQHSLKSLQIKISKLVSHSFLWNGDILCRILPQKSSYGICLVDLTLGFNRRRLWASIIDDRHADSRRLGKSHGIVQQKRQIFPKPCWPCISSPKNTKRH